jgi:hypothetical protein
MKFYFKAMFIIAVRKMFLKVMRGCVTEKDNGVSAGVKSQFPNHFWEGF